MRLITIVVGALSTNCYVLAPDQGSDCFVVDPGAQGGLVADELAKRGLKPKYVLSTHGHADHTGGVTELTGRLGGEYAVAGADLELAVNPPAWLTAMLTGSATPPEPSLLLKGGGMLAAGGVELNVIATPGHTPGSMCFIADDIVFTGDTLFKGSIGRYDLPGGDGKQELQSIRDCLLSLPDKVRVYPGHGPATTIGQERKSNPYLQARPR